MAACQPIPLPRVQCISRCCWYNEPAGAGTVFLCGHTLLDHRADLCNAGCCNLLCPRSQSCDRFPDHWIKKQTIPVIFKQSGRFGNFNSNPAKPAALRPPMVGRNRAFRVARCGPEKIRIVQGLQRHMHRNRIHPLGSPAGDLFIVSPGSLKERRDRVPEHTYQVRDLSDRPGPAGLRYSSHVLYCLKTTMLS